MPHNICYLNAASYSPLPLKTMEAGRAAVVRKGQPWTLPPALPTRSTSARAPPPRG